MATNSGQRSHTSIRLAASPEAFSEERVSLQALKNDFEHLVKGPMDARYPGKHYAEVNLSFTYPKDDRPGHFSADLLPVSPDGAGIKTWNYLALNRKPHYFTSEDARFELLLAFVLVVQERYGIEFEIRSTVNVAVRRRAVEAARMLCPDMPEPDCLPISDVIERPDHLDFRA